jgi:hypothetical protein
MRMHSVFLLLLSLLFVACKKERASSVKPESPAVIEDDPLITKARNYFNTNVLQAGQSVIGSRDLRQSLKKNADWDKAYISVTAKKDIVAVPLKFERQMKLKTGSNELELNRQSRLLIYEGSDGRMKAEVVTYIPDQASTPEKFSGFILVEDWAGNSIARYAHQKNQSSNLTRTQSDCIKIDWYVCDVTESGSTYNCQYLYSEYIGSCNESLPLPGEEYIEIEKRRQEGWTVYRYSGPNSDWWVTGFDILKARGGVFTAVIPNGSIITWSAPYNWRQDYHVTDFTGTVADSDIGGSFINPTTSNVVFTTDEQKLWFYNDVF